MLAERIRERAVAWAVAAVDAATIDRINIYQASRMAMRMAVSRLNPAPDFLLVDAVPLELAVPQRALIKGDVRCHAIAAASILAKVQRDACMRAWDAVFPEYGLASHKGYSTPEHYRALEQHGPTPLHRLSFEPVRAHSRFPLDYKRATGSLRYGGRRMMPPDPQPPAAPRRLPAPCRCRRRSITGITRCRRSCSSRSAWRWGCILLIVPWTDSWDGNYFSGLVPQLQHYWGNIYVRGAVSGLGLVNLYISLVEMFRLRRFSRR